VPKKKTTAPQVINHSKAHIAFLTTGFSFSLPSACSLLVRNTLLKRFTPSFLVEKSINGCRNGCFDRYCEKRFLMFFCIFLDKEEPLFMSFVINISGNVILYKIKIAFRPEKKHK